MTAPADRAATLGEVYGALATAMTVTNGAGLYQALAIVGALAEARAIDPMAVAKWADFFAATLPPLPPPDAREAVRAGLAGFAAAIRSMATLPAGAGKA